MRTTTPLELGVELKKVQLFGDLPRQQFGDVLARCQLLRVERDKPIVQQGEVASGIPVLLQGLAKLQLDRVLIEVCRGPALLCLSGTVDAAPCPMSVIAVRTCDVAIIERTVFLQSVHSSPAASQQLVELCTRESRSFLARVPELVGGSVEERLSSLLDRLSERHGSPLDDGRYMALPLRRCDLAMMIHATTETVSRTLAEWERRGWLRSNRAGLWWSSRRAHEGLVAAPPPESQLAARAAASPESSEDVGPESESGDPDPAVDNNAEV